MASRPDLDAMDDEEALYAMMNATDNFEERKAIRNRLRNIRETKGGGTTTVIRVTETSFSGTSSEADRAATRIRNDAQIDKARKMKQFEEDASFRSSKTESGADGSQTTTHTSTSTQKSQDGTTTVTKQTKTTTKVGGFGGTAYGVTKTQAGPGGARSAFKQMDASSPGGGRPNFLSAGGGGGGGRVAVQRSPSAIKQMLLDWCKAMTREYSEYGVNITNFSSSWNDGMAFCALIHHFFPNAFDFKKLNPKNRRFNFTLAFDAAEKLGDVSPLLEVDDMVRMKNPDWKCVFTYVQSYYRRFRADANPPKSPTTPEAKTAKAGE